MRPAAGPPSGDTARASTALKSVALPVEHGGWGFLLEPAALGLVLAPSLAGLALALAALGAFLARHPLKLALADWRRGTRYPRTAWAEGFAAFYALVALIGLGLAAWTARERFWLPVALATPLGLLQLSYDARHRGRELAAELAGAAALGSIASAIVLAHGWPLPPALGLWLIMGARAAVSVLYIRARLRLDRGFAPDTTATWTCHVLALALVGALAAAGWAPWLALAAFLALLARAAQGLSRFRRPVRVQVVGLREMGFGLLTVLLVALGYALRL